PERFCENAQELERLVRGMNPWPSAYTFLNGKTFKIWEASVVSVLNGDGKPSAEPGTVMAADTGRAGIHVACGKDILVLTEVQLEGKKRMDAASFLRGYQVEPGTVLRDHKE
ncbi:MAG: methionyl-tRNA formyltransferase, partial [Lachnospiraceae bacterium]